MSTLSVIDVHALKSPVRSVAVDVTDVPHAHSDAIIRAACDADVDAIHRLVSEHLAEGRMQQVRCGVMATGGVANGGCDLGGHEVAWFEHAGGHLHRVQPWPGTDARDARHAGLAVRRSNAADV